MQYKEGDRVIVGNIDTGNRYKGERGMGAIDVADDMVSYIGKTVTIDEVKDGYYRIEEDRGEWMWTIAMFDGLSTGNNGTYRDWEATLKGAV